MSEHLPERGLQLRSLVSRSQTVELSLERFVSAQDQGGTYQRAIGELRAGRKASHWMWFVFPQLAGLGRSTTAQRFAISDLGEADAYLSHPILGRRLLECASILAERDGRDAGAILGPVDALKLRSSATLFRRVAPGEQVFDRLLKRYFDGEPDPETERILST